MNVPNKLTISRFALTVLFLGVVFARLPFFETVALGLFSAAGLTDYFDGKIARRDHLITNFGILMDPLADKILVCSAFICFVSLGWVPAWMAVLVVMREFIITGLRMLGATQNLVLAAEGFGKHKTIWQIIAVISVLVLHSYPSWGAFGQFIFGFPASQPWSKWFTIFSLYLAILLTFTSGAIYLWRNRRLYLEDL